MRRIYNSQTRDGFGQLESVLPAVWGLAARAQSHIPGASALTAPPPTILHTPPRSCRVLTKWLGGIEAAVAFGGVAGLISGVYLLATGPLLGVVIMLASMAMLVSSVGKLCEAQEVRHDSNRVRESLSRTRAGNCVE